MGVREKENHYPSQIHPSELRQIVVKLSDYVPSTYGVHISLTHSLSFKGLKCNHVGCRQYVTHISSHAVLSE